MATAGRDKLAQLCEGTAAQRYFETGNEKMLAGIMGTLAPALGSLRPLAGVQGAPFSVRRWMREGGGTLWMPYRAKQIPALRGLISCWMGLAISEALSLPPSATRRIWFHVDELDAFADPAAPGLIRAWREFSPRELYPTGYAPSRNVRTLVTVDERADGWHICFMQDWGTPGPSVTNTVELLATAMYREACAIAEQQAGRAGGVRGLVGRVRSRLGLAQPDPARFWFYEHTPPRGDGLLRESFRRVVLRFEGGQYRQSEWQCYKVVPALIQSARYDCAREASQGKGQTLLPKQN